MNSSSTTSSMHDNREPWKEIKNTLRNTPSFEKIVPRMQYLGHEKTTNQCRNRIKTLKTKYNKCQKMWYKFYLNVLDSFE